MKRRRLFAAVCALCGAAALTLAPQSWGEPEGASPRIGGQGGESALAKMPVAEITVFKDGHAFVLHQGRMPTNAAGNVLLDYLPAPILGTFWPYSADRNVQLISVTASPRKVTVARPALSVRDLLEANPGAQAILTTVKGAQIAAQIIGVPRPAARASAVAYGDEEADYRARYVYGGGYPGRSEPTPEMALLKTAGGVLAMPLASIQSVKFTGGYRRTLASQEERSLLTLKLNRPGGRVGKTADVGMIYLQKGVRWIPQYKIALDGKGNATLRLQAGLVNELTDLNDVTVNLVMGVPSFFFKDTIDPISLQQTFPALSRHFQSDSRTGFAFSNAIMGQGGFGGGGGFGGAGGRGGFAKGPGPWDAPEPAQDALSASRNEDLFVFTVRHVTLKRGQNAVIPVAEYPLKYRDVFSVEIPGPPPPEVESGGNRKQDAELARLLREPRALHRIRLTNTGLYPLTTAPALVISGDRVVGQSMTSYTPVGGSLDLTLTTAGEIKIKKMDREAGRTANAAHRNGHDFDRVDMAGTLTLTNHGEQAAELEVSRAVPGNVAKADHDGVAEMANPFEDEDDLTRGGSPLTGKGRFTWKVRLEPGQTVELGYAWFYYYSP